MAKPKLYKGNLDSKPIKIDRIEKEWDIDEACYKNDSTKLDIIREHRERKDRF